MDKVSVSMSIKEDNAQNMLHLKRRAKGNQMYNLVGICHTSAWFNKNKNSVCNK